MGVSRSLVCLQRVARALCKGALPGAPSPLPILLEVASIGCRGVYDARIGDGVFLVAGKRFYSKTRLTLGSTGALGAGTLIALKAMVPVSVSTE